jgi:hypothetical protein
MAELVPKIDVMFAAFSVLHGEGQRASVQAKGAAFVTDMREDIVKAIFSDYLFRGKAGQEFGPSIPIKNFPIQVHEVDAVIEAVE